MVPMNSASGISLICNDLTRVARRCAASPACCGSSAAGPRFTLIGWSAAGGGRRSPAAGGLSATADCSLAGFSPGRSAGIEPWEAAGAPGEAAAPGWVARLKWSGSKSSGSNLSTWSDPRATAAASGRSAGLGGAAGAAAVVAGLIAGGSGSAAVSVGTATGDAVVSGVDGLPGGAGVDVGSRTTGAAATGVGGADSVGFACGEFEVVTTGGLTAFGPGFAVGT